MSILINTYNQLAVYRILEDREQSSLNQNSSRDECLTTADELYKSWVIGSIICI